MDEKDIEKFECDIPPVTMPMKNNNELNILIIDEEDEDRIYTNESEPNTDRIIRSEDPTPSR